MTEHSITQRIESLRQELVKLYEAESKQWWTHASQLPDHHAQTSDQLREQQFLCFQKARYCEDCMRDLNQLALNADELNQKSADLVARTLKQQKRSSFQALTPAKHQKLTHLQSELNRLLSRVSTYSE